MTQPSVIEPTTMWIIGRGGLLGGAVGARLARDAEWGAPPIDWTSPDATDQLSEAVSMFAATVGATPWTVAWCAGVGVATSPADLLDRETSFLLRVLDGLRACPGPGRFFLASSAGGVYAGSGDRPIHEGSEPAPVAEYGRSKLLQESFVRDWAASTGHRAAIGRIANLYGPRQSVVKQQGLITHLCRSSLIRRPISIYVSLDTVRDYLYADDCGHQVLAVLDRLRTVGPGETVTKILASGRPVTIGAMVAEVGRVAGRPPLVVLGSSPDAELQGGTLMFRSDVWPDIDRMSHTTLPAGIARVAASIRRLHAASPAT